MNSDRDFATLYAIVNRRMVAYRDARLRSGLITHAEAAWFSDLVLRFEREFARWQCPCADAGVRAYLVSLTTAPRAVRLAGHVFLHIGYDLPRTVGASLDAYPALDASRLREIFVGAAPLLSSCSMRAAGAMHPVWLLRGVAHARSVAALAHAVQAARASAWRFGETAHASRLEPRASQALLMRALSGAYGAAVEAAGSERDTGGDRVPASATRWRRSPPRSTAAADAWTIERFGEELVDRIAIGMTNMGRPSGPLE